MPQLEHIDITHLLYKLALLIELGITSEEHTQALAFLSIGEQQDKRVLIALTVNRIKRPHHTSPKCADIDCVSASHLPIRDAWAIQNLSRRAAQRIRRNRNGSYRKPIEYVGKTAPMVFIQCVTKTASIWWTLLRTNADTTRASSPQSTSATAPP